MQYINPIEILELSSIIDTTSIDSDIIKKTKRKLFAEIDLSDNGHFEYYGLQLTKGDCEKVIDELSNKDLKEFYLYLASNKKLNTFLVNGNDSVFINFQQDSIFKLPEFIKFISPYFAPKFDKALLHAFESLDEEQTKSILKTSFLIDQSEINIAYKGVTNHINSEINDIDEITKEIKNENSNFNETTIDGVLKIVKESFPNQILNCLPQYFQSQILKVANSINYLQLSIWEAFDNTQVPNNLLEYLLTLNIGGLDKPTFENNYKIVKKKNDERILQEKNAPLLKKWATILLELRKYIKEVENKSITSNLAYEKVKNLFDINELNSLPNFADDIRTQIGFSIRSLSISMWNDQTDVKSAINTINLLLKIKVDDESRLKFENDKSELDRLEKENKGILTCWFCDNNTPDKNSQIKKTIYYETSRSRSFNQKRVQFSQAEVILPRCKSCSDVHSEGSDKHLIVILISIVICGIIGAINDGHFIVGGIVGLIIGGITSWIITEMVDNPKIKAKGIKLNNESSLRYHPILKDRMSQGWTFSKPTA